MCVCHVSTHQYHVSLLVSGPSAPPIHAHYMFLWGYVHTQAFLGEKIKSCRLSIFPNHLFATTASFEAQILY